MSNTKIRIRDIAEAIGVSTATVSNVIHGKTEKISAPTKAKVEEALKEFGYTPNMAAISLVQNKTPLIGIVISSAHRYRREMLTDPFVSHILDSVCSCLENRDYFLMLRRESDITNIPRYACMWNWAGALFLGFDQIDYDKLNGKMPVPFIVIDGSDGKSDAYSTSNLDNFGAGRQAGHYLMQKGRTALGYLADKLTGCDVETNDTVDQRYRGFAAGIRDIDPGSPLPAVFNVDGELDERRAAYKRIAAEVAAGRLSGVFCIADRFAIELINYMKDEGFSMPDALSVIGFDDIEEATVVRPRLTTFRQDLTKRGVAATELLLDMIENDVPARHLLDDVELIERDSVTYIK